MLDELLPHLDTIAMAVGAVVFFVIWRRDAEVAAERDKERDERTLEAIGSIENNAQRGREALLGAVKELSEQIRRSDEHSREEHDQLRSAIDKLHDKISSNERDHLTAHAKMIEALDTLKGGSRK